MTSLQWALTAVAVALLVSLSGMALDARRSASPRAARLVAFAATLAFALALALRSALVEPTFIHANFHGGAILEGELGFPREAVHRSLFGQFGFLALGAVAALFGRSFEVICATNQVFAALVLVVLAALAARYAGSPVAAATTAAIALLHPALLRVAASEDVHNLAMLLGCVALLAMDVHATTGRRWALAAATFALVLAVHTRQTFYLFVPVAYLLALGRGSWRRLLAPELLASALVVIAVLAVRVAATAGNAGDAVTLKSLPVLLATPTVITSTLRHHPLLDAVRFGPVVPVLLAVGLWRCLARAGVTRALAVAFLGIFVITLPFGFPIAGVEFSFRTPVLALGIIVAGIGGAWIVEAASAHARSRSGAWVAGAVALGACALLPIATASWASVRAIGADFEEYQFLRRVARELPPDIVLVRIPTVDPTPSYWVDANALRAAGVAVRVVEAPRLQRADFERPVLFLAGVQCWGYSLQELTGLDPLHLILSEKLGRMTFGHQVEAASSLPPPGLRPECAAFLDGAVPVGPRALIHRPLQDVPFVLYREDPLILQFYAVAARGPAPGEVAPTEPSRRLPPAGDAELALVAPLREGGALGGYTVTKIDAVGRDGVLRVVCRKEGGEIELVVALRSKGGPEPPVVAGRYAVFYRSEGQSAEGEALARTLAAILEANASAPTPAGMAPFMQ